MASLLHGVENSSASSYVQIHTRVSLWYLREAAAEWKGHGHRLSQHWVESWPCSGLVERPWANPFTFLRPPFPHMWKELGAILGGVLVRSECLVHEKCLTQGGWEQTPVHSGDGSEGLPWRLSSVIFQRSRRKQRCFPHVGPWGLFSDLPLCRLVADRPKVCSKSTVRVDDHATELRSQLCFLGLAVASSLGFPLSSFWQTTAWEGRQFFV